MKLCSNEYKYPGPTPPTEGNPEDVLFAVWKNSSPEARPKVEKDLLQHLRRHASKVCWMVLHSHQPDLIDEIAIDTVLDLAAFKELSAFSTWVHARCLNKCRRTLKNQIRRKEVSLDSTRNPVIMSAEARNSNVEESCIVKELLSRLTEHEQEWIRLKVQEKYSDADIGKELGLPRETARWQWKNLLKKLRKMYHG